MGVAYSPIFIPLCWYNCIHIKGLDYFNYTSFKLIIKAIQNLSVSGKYFCSSNILIKGSVLTPLK